MTYVCMQRMIAQILGSLDFNVDVENEARYLC